MFPQAAMKGRKSTPDHPTSPTGSPPSDNDSGSSSKEHDRFLPIANVSRIMKRSLPANAKISKEAKETIQECVSEFISFITGEASDKCQREKRKTINGDDLLWAMTTLGFDSYVVPLKTYLSRFRESEGEKNIMARQQPPASAAAGDYDHPLFTSEGSGGGGVDGGGFYAAAPASQPSIRGGHGFYGMMGGGVHEEGGRASGRGRLHGIDW